MNAVPRITMKPRRGEDEVSTGFQFTQDAVRLGGLSKAIQAYRRSSLENYNNLPMPTTKDEAWRRTDLRGLELSTLRQPDERDRISLSEIPESLLMPVAGEAYDGQVIIYPGGSQVQIKNEISKSGVIFTNLRTAEKEYPHLVDEIIGKVIPPEEGKFAAMAGAFAQDGIFLYVPKGVHLLSPLHSLIWAAGKNLANITHILVYLADGSSATYVQEMASEPVDSGQGLNCYNLEIHVGANANLQFVELQSLGQNIWNFGHERVRVGRDGRVDWIFGALGSRLTKTFTELSLAGEGGTGKMSGFYFTEKNQHFDHDTQQNHLARHTTSDLLFKGALVGESRSIWQGMIYVAPGAIKTDGYQANRNLVLSEKARADSIPGLEILADDVRCTHGATVGKVDADQVFYLMARGIPETEARRLVVEGFFDQIMERIPFEGVRERFSQSIQAKLNSITVI
ncbi:MAG TPA: Fe-S cluster assembly protein SufD [Anaerolineaceae bacterium]